jgi:hypothetical protein
MNEDEPVTRHIGMDRGKTRMNADLVMEQGPQKALLRVIPRSSACYLKSPFISG